MEFNWKGLTSISKCAIISVQVIMSYRKEWASVRSFSFVRGNFYGRQW